MNARRSQRNRKKHSQVARRADLPTRNQQDSKQIRQHADGSVTATQVQFMGPLPPPEMLEHYERIVPGFAARLLDEFEQQGQHRRKLEAKVIGGNVEAQRRAQPIAAICFVVTVVGAAVAAAFGNTGAAVAIAGMDFLTFGGIYVYGQAQQRKHLGSE